MNFGQAIEALKQGKKVSRKGWNGKNMWLVLMAGKIVHSDALTKETKKHVPDGQALNVGPYIVMWTAQGTWQPGWLASQPDMLADDWGVVE